MLADAFYRADDFEKAGDALDGIDVSSNQLVISRYPTLNMAKLTSFKGQTPYEVHGNGEITCLKLSLTSFRYSVTFDFEKMRIISSGP
jgi:hypothetical protein